MAHNGKAGSQDARARAENMLARLKVSNLAVVEEAEAVFGGGLNVITGETGSGKSVLMGALSLALGARADASCVRDGAQLARIEAEFLVSGQTAAAIAAMLDELGLPPCEDGTLLLRRTISAGGGGRVWVNDSASTVQTLKNLGRALVDVHGPNDSQRLVEEGFQRELVDAFAPSAAREAYAAAWRQYSALVEERDALNSDSAESVAEEIERLRYSVDEIEAAALSAEDDDDLPRRHAAAAHAAEIVEAAGGAAEFLSGDGDGDGSSAATALVEAERRVRAIAKYHEPAAAWADEISSLVERAQELSRELAGAASRIDDGPEALAALDERLTLVNRLKRKYGCQSAEEVRALAEKRAARLAELEGRDKRLAELGELVAAANKAVLAAGKALSAARAKSGAKLAKEITKELHGLGFLKASLAVAVEPAAPSPSGCDRVDFLFEPNPGESARSLKDVASTGEIARVMLAVKSVTAAHDSTPVIVFDEVDSNVGGETGRAVGERLRDVARHRQVIAITHLPQSAVFGETHFAVSKTVSGGRTRTKVEALSREGRVAEIARMLGGETSSGVVRRHAEELLQVPEGA